MSKTYRNLPRSGKRPPAGAPNGRRATDTDVPRYLHRATMTKRRTLPRRFSIARLIAEQLAY